MDYAEVALVAVGVLALNSVVNADSDGECQEGSRLPDGTPILCDF